MDVELFAGIAVSDLERDGFVGAVAQRGIDPEMSETCQNGVRKVIYRDPDGNEVGVGGAPVEPGTKL